MLLGLWRWSGRRFIRVVRGVRGVRGALKVIVNSAPPHKAIFDCAPIKGGTPPHKAVADCAPKTRRKKDGDANKLAIWGRSRWSLAGDADF